MGLTFGVMLLKALVLFVLAFVFRIKKNSNRWLFTLSLAQAGEFGFCVAKLLPCKTMLFQLS
ncbi:hypothetical protein QW180_30500 [Vibrio sinaloensis]|nr:hypothetical protein [Vibrio sinaloensis]